MRLPTFAKRGRTFREFRDCWQRSRTTANRRIHIEGTAETSLPATVRSLELAWKKQLALFRPVLAASRVWEQTEVWQVELHVRAEWPGGSAATNLVSQRADRLNWLLPSGKRLSLTVQADCESAVVTCDDDERTLPIPCRAHELADGLTLSVRDIVVARSPMPLA